MASSEAVHVPVTMSPSLTMPSSAEAKHASRLASPRLLLAALGAICVLTAGGLVAMDSLPALPALPLVIEEYDCPMDRLHDAYRVQTDFKSKRFGQCSQICLKPSLKKVAEKHGVQYGSTCAQEGCTRLVDIEKVSGQLVAFFECPEDHPDLLRASEAGRAAHAHAADGNTKSHVEPHAHGHGQVDGAVSGHSSRAEGAPLASPHEKESHEPQFVQPIFAHSNTRHHNHD